MINLENIKKIYFVGIGGIAMSAAANLARESGFEVLGSDSKEVYSPAKDVLDENKIEYFIGYNESHIKESAADLFVLSAGEGTENPEVKYILEQSLPYCGFAELLFELSKNILRIVVTGTHGKTTTSAFLGHMLKNLDNSSFLVGGVLQNYGNNFHNGSGHYFVFEGDEYKNLFDDPTPKFHYYKPDILVLTNLEYDHPDMFESFEKLEDEFRLLISNMPEDGLIIYNADSSQLTKLVHESNVTSVGFGVQNRTDFFVESVNYGSDYTTINISNKNSSDMLKKMLEQTEEYKIQLPGKINVYNALAVITLLRTLGFKQEQILLDLLTFTGVKRRFEIVAQKNGIIIVDDYAHHPTAVRETLEAARLKYFLNGNNNAAVSLPRSASDVGREREVVQSGVSDKKLNIENSTKLWAIFEPHTFSRTKATFAELVKSFNAADEILIAEIYPAREKISDATINSEEVVQAIALNHKHVRLVKNKQEALSILKSEIGSGDVVVIMAVGSFNRLAYELRDMV